MITPPRGAVTVQELKRAWLAVQAGQFRPQINKTAASTAGNEGTRAPGGHGQFWEPEEFVLPVEHGPNAAKSRAGPCAHVIPACRLSTSGGVPVEA